MKKDELEKVVIELHHAIVGNGTKGLAERMNEIELEVRKLRMDIIRYVSIAIGAGAVIGFLLDKIIKFL